MALKSNKIETKIISSSKITWVKKNYLIW